MFMNKINDSKVNPVYAVNIVKDGKCNFRVIDRNNYKDKLQNLIPNDDALLPFVGLYFEVNPESLANDLPGIQEVVEHPINKKRMSLRSAIINLNDNHRWTREKIADWIETLENQSRFKF